MINSNTQQRERADRNWLVLSYPGNPTIRINACVMDRILADESAIYMSVDGITVLLTVLDSHTAASVTACLAPYTRSSPISCIEAYLAAKQSLAATSSDVNADTLYIGNDKVLVEGMELRIGDRRWHIREVDRLMKAEQPLQWPGVVLQAGLAALAFAVRYRDEDVDALSRRIAEYESIHAIEANPKQ